jgi:hypothetical protein
MATRRLAAGSADGAICSRAGTGAPAPEFIFRNPREDVAKPKRSNAELPNSDDREWPRSRARVRIDSRLASLYQGTLEETIPEDMMSLVARIGSQHQS